MAVQVPGLIAIIVSYVVVFAIGLWAAWKNRRQCCREKVEDVFLAGRDIGLWLGMFTLTATWVDGSMIAGTVEGVFSQGMPAVMVPLGYAVTLVLAGLFYVERMRSRGYITMLDAFEKKFGEVMTVLMFIPALSGDLFWCAATLASLGTTLTVVIGMDHSTAVIVSTAVVLAYTLFGGLYSVSYTDVIQVFLLFIGLGVAAPFALSHPSVTPLPDSMTTWVGEVQPKRIATFIDVALQIILGGIPFQPLFQRVLAVKTIRKAQIVCYAGAVGTVLGTIPPVLLGLAAASSNWTETAYEGTIPIPQEDKKFICSLVLQYLCPFVVSMFGLGAMSAAVMSSADSLILSSSSLFSGNVWRVLRRHKAKDQELVWVMRFFMLVFAVVAAYLAIKIESIFSLATQFLEIVYVVLFPQLTAVLFVDFTNAYGSIVGYILSWVIRGLSGEPMLSLQPIIFWPFYDHEANGGEGEQLFPHRTFCVIVAFIAIIGVSYVTDFFFKNDILPKRFDICYSVVNNTDRTEKKENTDSSPRATGTDNKTFQESNGEPKNTVL
ncbi:high-affinity choline transporter 1-like [Lingula anatina]|uniref:High-affinity choline transporter 1-like n=1 Tax=Lingula anatina TaxID=7574 RepID=A0A1S3HST9_LINAN|nr:high-affinity choline transporter 1-like [Lingula anatina]|eukprot:XP_013389088.1 high-affinity choline transporter 1-like [Lingula anatina]